MSDPTEEYSSTIQPPVQSILTVTNTGTFLAFHLTCERPNWWWRMWQYLILGFRWEKVEKPTAHD